MSTNTQTTTDPIVILKEIADTISNYVLESVQDFQDLVARPKVRHWLRILVIVGGYIMVRPLIEQFFKWSFEKQSAKEEAAQKKKREEEDKKLIAEGLKKPKKDGNSLRVGRGVSDKGGAVVASGSESTKTEGVADGDKNVDGKNNSSLPATASTTTKNNKRHDEGYENSDEEDFAEKIRASGVLEWGRDARRRKGAVKTTEPGRKTEQMDEEELLQLLDWSEDEDGQRRPKKQN